MQSQEKLIDIDNISVNKNNKSILENISLTVKVNDFITIIGPNGAGKSMLIKCIMGFYKPTSGNIAIKNNLKIGYMPQSIHTNSMIPLKVSRFLTMNNKATTATNNPAKYDDIITKTAIADVLDMSLHSLSGGQMQKVLMARALLMEPEIMILDEPTQNLDIAGQMAFYKLLDKIYKTSNISILMVSHDLNFVMQDSKQVICLFKHICCSGESSTIAQNPAFTSLFGEDMAHLLKSYQHTSEHINHKH